MASGYDPAKLVVGDQDHATALRVVADVPLCGAGSLVAASAAGGGLDAVFVCELGLALVGGETPGFEVGIDLLIEAGLGLFFGVLPVGVCHGCWPEEPERHHHYASNQPLHCGFSLVELLLDWLDANTMLPQGEGYM